MKLAKPNVYPRTGHLNLFSDKVQETKAATSQYSDLKGFLLLKEKCNKELGRVATEKEFKEWLG